ncbi:MAG: signal peptidase II [bacterium]|nr:signal peptidase II [bacterium]
MLKSRSIWYLALTAVIIAIADQWTKMLVVSKMRLHQTITLPVDFVQLTYIRNKGGAFGLFQDQMLFFIIAGIVTIGFVLRYMAEMYESDRVTAYVCAAIMGGAIGNMIDRVRLNYVVDFIDLKWWPVFNVADIAITCGVAVLLAKLLMPGHDGKKAQEDTAEVGKNAEEASAEPAADAGTAKLAADEPEVIAEKVPGASETSADPSPSQAEPAENNADESNGASQADGQP